MPHITQIRGLLGHSKSVCQPLWDPKKAARSLPLGKNRFPDDKLLKKYSKTPAVKRPRSYPYQTIAPFPTRNQLNASPQTPQEWGVEYMERALRGE